jgi:hypothetical protein
LAVSTVALLYEACTTMSTSESPEIRRSRSSSNARLDNYLL